MRNSIPDGTWHIINTATGQVTGSILTAAGVAPHDTDMSANGQFVYMEGVTSSVLYNVSAPGFSLPPGFDTTYTTPSHGISLSPDGKTV